MYFEDILKFWFEEIDPKQHFIKDVKFDELIRSRFATVYQQALKGETASWRINARGRLAEIIVLDQFSRNMFRDTPQAFQSDALALRLAQKAVQVGADRDLATIHKSFLYMPYMHSEDAEVHKRAVELFSQPGLEYGLKFELLHKQIIDRFGRYPHRNKILGRTSTNDEINFLNQENSSF